MLHRYRSFRCCATWLAVLLICGWLTPAHSLGQNSSSKKPKVKSTTPATSAEEKELKLKGEVLTKVKFSRTADEAFQAILDLAAGLPEEMSDGDRLRIYVQAGAWDKVQEVLEEQHPEIAQRLHTKIVSDLGAFNSKSVLLPMDIVKLADISAAELDSRQTLLLGRLLMGSLAGTDSRAELMQVLRKGTERLGGTDPTNRRTAGLILASAELLTEAKEFGVQEKDVPKVFPSPPPDEGPQKPTPPTWEQLVAAVRNPPSDEEGRKQAFDNLHQFLVQSPPEVAKGKLAALVADKKQSQFTLTMLTLLGRKTASSQTESDFQIRKVNLEQQHFVLKKLAGVTALDQSPWQAMADLFAKNWITEVQHTLKMYPTWVKATTAGREKYQHVPIEELIRFAPNQAWLQALQPQLSGMVKSNLFRLTMFSEDIARALPYIREMVKADQRVAAEFANLYLTTWANRHNPNLSPDLLKQYRSDSQTIILTRIEQETCLKQLGELLSSLDSGTRKLLNQDQVVLAFDLCHSKAEIYTRDHIKTVFGKLEDLPPSLILSLTERMRVKLASSWREISVQRDAATKRTTSDLFQLVNEGYAEANHVSQEWLAAHDDNWRMNCAAGSLLSDWSEFAYFQAAAASQDSDRFADYLKRTSEAHTRFRNGAKAYAAQLPKIKRAEFEVTPYRAWFYGLLGIAQDSDVNLRKGITKEGLQELRQAMVDLPNGAGDTHLEMFAAMVADNVQKGRIAPEMKYRYLSSAVQITGRRPTIYPAEERVQYYDSLLKEIRLQARIDGSNIIRQGSSFGMFVNLVHTADIARESGGFEKYLLNKVRKTVSGKTVTEEPFYRDRFEEALRLALGEFFEVRAIVFADPNSEARVVESTSADKTNDGKPLPAPRGGWRETPLAYLHLVAKDPTVDRVPPLEIELDFFDRDGKVVIPVPSTPVLIEVKEAAPALRAATNVTVTQIVDARELADGRLKMDVVANANGLVPYVRELLDLDSYPLKVTQIDEREGLLIRELHNDREGLYALSEQTWTIHFDPAPLLRGAYDRIVFSFPKPRREDIQVTYRAYEDLDPVAAAEKITLREGKEAEKIARPNYIAWGFGGALALAAVIALAVLVLRPAPPPVADQRPLFQMPREVTPFAVASLLHRLRRSRQVTLSEQQQQELRSDLALLEKATFAPQNGSPGKEHSVGDLETLAARWLKIATSNLNPESAARTPATSA